MSSRWLVLALLTGCTSVEPPNAHAPLDASADGLCPPRAPYGVGEGDRLPDPALSDCDGNAASLHALCEKKVAYQFHFAGW